jgi:MoxR-like ATPase
MKTDKGIVDTIKVKHLNKAGSHYDSSTATYYIGNNWRIIATMNSYDKNSLFMMSFAFMRRFAQIHIPIPTDEQLFELIDSRAIPYNQVNNLLKDLVKNTKKTRCSNIY